MCVWVGVCQPALLWDELSFAARPLWFSTFSWNVVFSISFVFVAQKMPKLPPNPVHIIKMLVEVALALHGGPLVPQMVKVEKQTQI